MNACARILSAPIIALAFAASGAPTAKADSVGEVERYRNKVYAVAGNAARALSQGSPIRLADTVETGARSLAELLFVDGTTLTLGESASIIVDNFVYAPGARGTFSATVKGAFRFVTGEISQAAEKQLVLRTPLAVIGVRGTDFWGGPIDGAYGVLLIDGEITVTTAGGELTLDEPGTGTTITAADEPPSPVVQWPQDKVARALAAVSFQ